MVSKGAKVATIVAVGAGMVGAGIFLSKSSGAKSGNLLINSSFDSGTLAPWTFQQPAGHTTGSAGLDTAVYRSPPASGKISDTSIIGGTTFQIDTLYQGIPVVPNATYRLSAWVRVTPVTIASGGGVILLFWENSTNSAKSAKILGATSGWTNLLATLKTSASASKLTVFLQMQNMTGSVNFDDVYVARTA